MNLFEYAIRNGLRFKSVRGNLNVEDLFAAPLTSNDGFNLDAIARGINSTLKAQAEESFVEVKANKATKDLEISLELVKSIIAEKIEAKEAAKNEKARRAEKAKLLEILATKEEEGLRSLSADELRARIEAL